MFLKSLACAVPPTAYTQAECWAHLKDAAPVRALKPRSHELLEKVLLANNGIRTRHFAEENLANLFTRDAQQLSEAYEREAPRLGASALKLALNRAELSSVDALFVCSCTGYLCPGLSSHIAQTLTLPSDTFLTDLGGAGCGAALPALRAACSYLSAHPAHRAAVVAVEICSAAFFVSDDPGVLISLCLFGDGAAAVVLEGEAVHTGPLRFASFETLHLPEHRDKIRFVNRNGFLCNQLDRAVPSISSQAVAALARRGNLAGSRLISHGGGRDVVENIRALLPEQSLEETLHTLRDYGNLSSPSVLFALDKALSANHAPSHGYWLAAFGAGFSAHSCSLAPLG
jgi:alkylresorcinol/alkylpyrone synthase